jgi:hypothetical protein
LFVDTFFDNRVYATLKPKARYPLSRPPKSQIGPHLAWTETLAVHAWPLGSDPGCGGIVSTYLETSVAPGRFGRPPRGPERKGPAGEPSRRLRPEPIHTLVLRPFREGAPRPCSRTPRQVLSRSIARATAGGGPAWRADPSRLKGQRRSMGWSRGPKEARAPRWRGNGADAGAAWRARRRRPISAASARSRPAP